MQDKKPDVPVSDDSNLVIVTTPEYVKEAIAEHAASRNHPDATLQDKGFVILSNDTGSDSETMAATPKAVKTAYDLASIANQHASNANNNANTRLAKDQNGADIQNKNTFINNLGLSNTVNQAQNAVPSSRKINNKPLIHDITLNASDVGALNRIIELNYIPGSEYIGVFSSDTPESGYAKGINFGIQNYDTGQIYIRSDGSLYAYYFINGKRPVGGRVWAETNTTTSQSGYIRKSVPTILISSSGKFTTNGESEGATVERLSQGTYLIKGVKGFSNDGAVSSIDIPRCQNDLPMVWVNHEVLPDGSIKLMTYHREHSDAPAFARNIREGYADGDLIDIPDGRFVSVRVQMPDTKSSQS